MIMVVVLLVKSLTEAIFFKFNSKKSSTYMLT